MKQTEEITINGNDIKESSTIIKSKILLVEDNDMNKKIVVMMLKNNQILCDIAANGDEALKMIMKNDYDIVLMDCQMPVMDGYECTTRIRQYEKNRRHTNIIAMTANAMEGDREKCLAVGMDDHISKPIDIELLLKLIRKHTEVTNIQDSEFLNKCVGVFMEITGLSLSDSEEIFEEFKKELPQIIKNMEDALIIEDFIAVSKLAHQLKGSCGNLRMDLTRQLAIDIEGFTLSKDKNKCKETIVEIKNMFM